MAKKNISVAIEEETLKEIDDLAAKIGLSRSAVIGLQLKAFNEGDIKSAATLFSQMGSVLAENKKEKDRRVDKKRIEPA